MSDQNVFLVSGIHPYQEPRITYVCGSRATAEKKALELLNCIHGDIPLPLVKRWGSGAVEKVQEYNGDVWIEEFVVIP
jgi:hypothetical protein